MSRLNRILIVVLLLQVGLLAITRMASRERGPERARKLFPKEKLDTSQVKRIRIAGQDGKAVALEQRAGKWVLASGGGYPVEASKVTEFLGKWPEVTTGAPVADKPAHHRALEVSPSSFQRRVTLGRAGGKDLIFFLGSSVGLKDVHLRFDGENPVYLAKGISAWDAGTAASDWVSTDYFKVERDQIASLTLKNAEGEIQLEKSSGGEWTLAGLEAGMKLKQSEVDSLLSSASAVALQEPVGERVEARFGLAPPAATLTLITRKTGKDADKAAKGLEDKGAGEKTGAGATGDKAAVAKGEETAPPAETTTHVLQIGAKEGDGYFARSASSRFVVKLSTWTAESLLKKKPADLAEKEKAPGEQDAPGAPDPAGALPPGFMGGGGMGAGED